MLDQKKRRVLIISFLFLFSFVLRLRFLADGLLHHDSVNLAQNVELFVSTGELEGFVEGRHAIVLIYSLFFFVSRHLFMANSAEYTVTLVTALFGSLSVIMLYLFVELHAKKNIFFPLAASLLLSTNPIFFSITTHARTYALTIFTILLSFYLLELALQQKKSTLLFLSGTILGITLFMRYSSILCIVPHIVYFTTRVLYPHVKQNGIKLKFVLKKTITTYLGFSIFFLLAPKILHLQSFASSDVSYLANYHYKLGYISFITDHILGSFSLVGIVFILLGIIFLLLYRHQLTLFVFSWVATIILFYSNDIIWVFVATVSHRYFAIIIPALAIIISFALLLLREKIPHGKHLATLVLITIILLSFLPFSPIVEFRHNYTSGKELVKSIEYASPQDLIFVIPGDHIFFEYYANRSVEQCPEFITSTALQDLQNKFKQAHIQNHKVYFFSECLAYPRTQKGKALLAQFISEKYQLTPQQPFSYEGFHHTENVLFLRQANYINLRPK